MAKGEPLRPAAAVPPARSPPPLPGWPAPAPPISPGNIWSWTAATRSPSSAPHQRYPGGPVRGPAYLPQPGEPSGSNTAHEHDHAGQGACPITSETVKMERRSGLPPTGWRTGCRPTRASRSTPARSSPSRRPGPARGADPGRREGDVMPAEMAALARDLAAETAVARDLVAGLDEAGWHTPTPATGWDIADQIAHLAYFDEIAVRSAVRPAEFRAALAEAQAAGGIDPDAIAARFRGRSGAQLLDWFDAARA